MTLSTADFELLLQANRIVSSKLNVDEVLEAVLELATKVVRAEASSMLLLDEKKNELYFDVAIGTAKESVKPIRLKVGEGIAGWVAKERQPLIVNDVTKDKRFTGKVDKSTNFKTRAILAVPLLSKGKLIGVIEAINKENGQDFSAQDREAFEVFASQSAVAIENARLFSAVMREKEKLATVFDEMNDGVILLDEAGTVVMLNPAGSGLLGFAADEIVGKKLTKELFRGLESDHPIDNLGQFDGKVTAVEFSRSEGKPFYLTALVHKLQLPNEEAPAGFLVILHDTTEEKRGERLKQNFLSLISHKLKTPLTVIVGYAPALLASEKGLTEFQIKALRSIESQGEHLTGLVDKLLRFTIVESETLNPSLVSRSLLSLVEEALDHLSTLLKAQGVRPKIDPSVGKLPEVSVDGALMADVLKNLIENAVKFNDKKEKEVQFLAEHNKETVTLRVRDNGVGIPPEEQQRIFDKFYQVESSFTGQVPGAGLGLALCKKVVEKMGGKITVQSQLGQGTTFSLIFPRK